MQLQGQINLNFCVICHLLASITVISLLKLELDTAVLACLFGIQLYYFVSFCFCFKFYFVGPTAKRSGFHSGIFRRRLNDDISFLFY
jgi:hypothetical protein